MAYTTINKSTDYFNTKLWSGNGSSQALTGIGHQTDMVWIKSRTDTRKHNLYDVVRGVQKRIVPNDSVAEDTVPGITAFGTDGFTVGSETDTNGSSRNFVGWSWSAGASAGSANNDGSVASTVSVNTTAGFSIVKWTGTGATATVGHGLGVEPSMIIIKNLTASRDWLVYHKKLGNTNGIYLDLNLASTTSSNFFNNTSPTSSVFTVGTDTDANDSSDDTIAYCFAEKTGYSKFGSYTGNGNADGTFVYTGFKPALVIIKRTDSSSGANWLLLDSVRSDINIVNENLFANLNDAETSTERCDFLSNGFKLRQTGTTVNGSGASYIFMAFGQSLVGSFGQSLVGSNNVPCTAR
jgi:hypothetical protein